jgi:uncharacterized protein (TIGR00251 family)
MLYRLTVHVITRARENKIIHEPGKGWKVKVSVPPSQGKANEKVIELIAEHFKTAKSNVTIIHGEKAKEKVIEIIM